MHTQKGLKSYDKRHGYRGVIANYDQDNWLDYAKKNFKIPEDYLFARVQSFAGKDVVVEIDKSKECFENYIAKHINKNLKYPKRALKNGIEGDVYIQFEITYDGYFINFSTIGPDKILEDEAYRIMSKLPKVKPGEYLGKKVNILYGLPISFRL